MRRIFWSVVVLVVAMSIFATSCSDDDSKSTTSTTSLVQFQTTSPEGQISVSLNGQLPPNWPSNFPLPSGATTAGSGSVGGNESTYQVGVFSTTQTAEDAFNFYKSGEGLTIEEQTSIGSGKNLVGSMKITAPFDGRITILTNDNKTLIIAALKT